MNTREKLSWTLLGAAVFFGIAAVSTDTSFFKNASLTGWLSLSGETNRLTVAEDALLLDGSPIGGGDTIWDNTDAVIAPASGQDTNVLRFTSGLADNATNVAAVVDTVSLWDDDGVQLLNVRNAGTNILTVSRNGGLMIGTSTADFWSGPAQNGESLVSWRDVANGDLDHNAIYCGVVDATGDYSTAGALDQYSDNQTFQLEQNAGSDSADITLENGKFTGEDRVWAALLIAGGGDPLVRLNPFYTDTDNETVFRLSSGESRGIGNLLEIQNNRTNKVVVSSDGRLTLAGQTNQIVFGSTNTAPVDPGTVTKWISVQVSGESAVYRLPLYE